jgi:hypothetical protein
VLTAARGAAGQPDVPTLIEGGYLDVSFDARTGAAA